MAKGQKLLLETFAEERFIDIFFVPNTATPLNELALGNLTEIASRPALLYTDID
jgi:hypothetical protein